MLLGYCLVPRIHVTEDKMQLDVVTALVRTEHDGVRGLVIELGKDSEREVL